jgi:predicted nucleic acid-binding protein
MDKIGFISPQVIFECLNGYLQLENEAVVETTLLIFGKYSLQVFDSKIIASALHADCTILYSEDMQHGLVIENKLTIINPFL